MVFTLANQQSFAFVPGQFITFHFQANGENLTRSYSIASIPAQAGTTGYAKQIEIAVSPSPGGPGTEFLFNLKSGDKVNVTGPFGRLVLRDETPKRYLLIATGTGITPYRAMLPELTQRLRTHPNLFVVILQGVQTPTDLLYREDFSAAANTHANLTFIACYSRYQPSAHQLDCRFGYVQQQFSQLKPNPDQDIVYLCGNPTMIDQSFAQLLDLGFAVNTIRREKYVSPKLKKRR